MSSTFLYIELESIAKSMSPNLASPVGRKTLPASSAVHDIERREVARLHLLAIDVGHHRPDLAPEDHRRNRAGIAMIMLRTS